MQAAKLVIYFLQFISILRNKVQKNVIAATFAANRRRVTGVMRKDWLILLDIQSDFFAL